MSSVGTDNSSLAIGFTFPILGGIFVGLRFWTRWRLKQERQLDDWLCIPAWLCVTGCCVSLLAKAFNGLATQPEDLESASEQQFIAQITGALTVFYNFASAFIKLSILFFYRRIFVGRVFDICNWTLVVLTILWLIYATLCWLLYCGTDLQANFEGPWDDCPPWGFEIQVGVYIWDTIIDFCLLLLPIPLIWQLQLNTVKKVSVGMIFLLGGFAFVAGLSNTIIQYVNWVEPIFVEDANGTFFQGIASSIYNWPSIEVGVGLIACNLPSLSHRSVFAIPKRLVSWISPERTGLREEEEEDGGHPIRGSPSKEEGAVLSPQRTESRDTHPSSFMRSKEESSLSV